MTFPYDFGFVPSTKADDGDPVDVLVLMDEPGFPGCVLSCRPIGVIEGEQGNKKNKERNDRIIAVEKDAHSWEDIKTIDQLGKQFARELEEFFVNYHKLSGKQHRVLGLKGPGKLVNWLTRKGDEGPGSMLQILVRFLVGGAVVSVFAAMATYATQEFRRVIWCRAFSSARYSWPHNSERRGFLCRD